MVGLADAAGGGLTAAGFGAIAGAATSIVDSAYGNTKKVINGKMSVAEAIVGTTVDTAIGTALGAMGSGSAADIAKSNQISSAAWKGLKTMGQKTVHPAVKAAAKKAVKTAARYAARTFIGEVGSTLVTTGISKGANWYAGEIYKSYAAAS